MEFVLYVDVAIKSYAISPKTGSTFDGFIDCTLEKFTGLIDRWQKAIVQVSHLPNQICVQESGLAESGTEYT